MTVLVGVPERTGCFSTAQFPLKKCLAFTPSDLAPTNEGVNQSRAAIGRFLDSSVTRSLAAHERLGAIGGMKKGKNIFGQEYWGEQRRAVGRYRVLLDLSSVIFPICPQKNILATKYSCHSPRHSSQPSLQKTTWMAVGGGQGQRGVAGPGVPAGATATWLRSNRALAI